MPYIKKEEREKFKLLLIQIETIFEYSITPGELNYLISSICNLYLKRKGKRYVFLNDVIGVLGCSKLELYRRLIASYEDKKIKENGDIF